MLKLLMNLQILKCAGSPECLHPVELVRILSPAADADSENPWISVLNICFQPGIDMAG